jgi:hypothetical protein
VVVLFLLSDKRPGKRPVKFHEEQQLSRCELPDYMRQAAKELTALYTYTAEEGLADFGSYAGSIASTCAELKKGNLGY